MPTSAEQDIIRGKREMTTRLSSGELRDAWNERIRAEALYSARTTSKAYVEMLKRKLLAVASRETNPQLAERSLRQCLDALGYTPQRGFPGNQGEVPPATPKSITDLSSAGRIQLILDTNIKKARSMGQMAAGESPVFLRTNPAWRLERTGARKKPRGDWKRRWEAAGESVGWHGALKRRFMALKDSPIWEALGSGTGGFKDALGSPYPPFAFGSGMAWTHVSRREWQAACEAEGVESGLGDFEAKIASGDTIQSVGGPEDRPNPLDALKSPPGSASAARLQEIRAKIRGEREREEGASRRKMREGTETAPQEAGEAAEKALAAMAEARAVISRRMRLLERVYLKAADLLRDRFKAQDEALERVSGAIRLYDGVLAQLREADARLKGYSAALRAAGGGGVKALAERYSRAADKTAKAADDAFRKASDERKALAGDIKAIEEAERSLTPAQREQRKVEEPTRELMKSIGVEERSPSPLAIEATNPRYGEGRKWRNNCQRCVPAFEARMRGYDVTALSSDGDKDGSGISLARNSKAMWKNRDSVPCHAATFRQTVEAKMAEWGDGARAEIRIGWKRARCGHVFFAMQRDGRTIYLDPQNPSTDASRYFDRAAPRGRNANHWILRIDNNEFTDEAKRCFVRRQESR